MRTWRLCSAPPPIAVLSPESLVTTSVGCCASTGDVAIAMPIAGKRVSIRRSSAFMGGFSIDCDFFSRGIGPRYMDMLRATGRGAQRLQ